MRRFFCLFLCLTCLLACLAMPETSAAEDGMRPIIRIGCILPQPTTPDIFANRQYYTIFIDELTKYTGWDYRPVYLSSEEAFPMLESGKIDLLMPTERNENRLSRISYTNSQFGLDVIGLFTRPDDNTFNPNDLSTLQGASIGLLENRQANNALEAFQKDNNLTLDCHYYLTTESMMAALASHEIDLVLDTATNVRHNAHYLLSLDTCPVHIAALATSQERLRAIDDAAIILLNENSLFHSHQYDFLHSQLESETTHFTPEETKAIREMAPLKIVLFGEHRPYIHYDKESQEMTGIYLDILAALEKDSGIPFQTVYTHSYDEAQEMLRDGRADLMLDIYTNARETRDFTFTAPLYVEKFSFVAPNRPDWQDISHLVIPTMYPSFRHFVEKMLPKTQIIVQPTTITALNTLVKEKADAAIIDNLQLQMERPLIPYPELSVVPTASLKIPMSLAIAPHHSRDLQGLLDKAILRLHPQKVEQIILHHTMNETPQLTFSHILHYYPLQCGLAFGMILLLLALLTFFYHHNRQIKQEQRKLEDRNLVLLDAIESIQIANDDRDSYKQMAETDPLTGLLNKDGIQREAKTLFLVPPGKGRCHALVITDLDHFKEANDIGGHQYGDTVLKEYATILRSILREEDKAGRFGGDEFIVLLRNVRPDDVAHIAERINKATREIPHSEDLPGVSASIGIALFPEHGEDYDTLFRAADHALYCVKKDGRDGYSIAQRI